MAVRAQLFPGFSMPRLTMLGGKVATLDTRRVQLLPKEADPYYSSPEHRKWREQVIGRAGRRCEAIDNGLRCSKAEPHHRMFADHRVERSDGGDLLDPNNGQCLCGAHHTKKTYEERSKRYAR